MKSVVGAFLPGREQTGTVRFAKQGWRAVVTNIVEHSNHVRWVNCGSREMVLSQHLHMDVPTIVLARCIAAQGPS